LPVATGLAVELLGPLEPHVQGRSRLGDGPLDLPSGGEHLPGVIEELRSQKGPTQLLLGPRQQLGHTRRGVLALAWASIPVHRSPPCSAPSKQAATLEGRVVG